MKNILFTLLQIFLVFNCFISSAQVADENSMLIGQYFNTMTTVAEGNAIIEGSFEAINSEEILKIAQKGSKNFAKIQVSTGSQNIIQAGDDNSVEYQSYYSSGLESFNVYQIGNNNDVQILGENSLIENMSIIQIANFKTIQIYNYRN